MAAMSKLASPNEKSMVSPVRGLETSAAVSTCSWYWNCSPRPLGSLLPYMASLHRLVPVMPRLLLVKVAVAVMPSGLRSPAITLLALYAHFKPRITAPIDHADIDDRKKRCFMRVLNGLFHHTLCVQHACKLSSKYEL